METISFDPTLVVYLLVSFALLVALGYLTHRLHLWLEKSHSYQVDVEFRDLASRETRQQLTAFLKKHNIEGSADIRDGIVLPPVPPEKLEPLATLFQNAAATTQQLSNPAACSLYVRDSVNDRFMLLGDLDLDHLMDAARVIQRVAEDRRKSRSLYKGLTDDEMKSMIRAGLSQWHKDHRLFQESNQIMGGKWDERPEFLMALSALELLFKVKGARND